MNAQSTVLVITGHGCGEESTEIIHVGKKVQQNNKGSSSVLYS